MSKKNLIERKLVGQINNLIKKLSKKNIEKIFGFEILFVGPKHNKPPIVKQPLMEEDHRWKTNFNGRRPSMEEDL